MQKVTDVAAIDIQYVDPETWFIGGKPLNETNKTSFFVEINITESTNSRDQKAEFVRHVFAEFSQWFNTIAQASYVVVQNIASDSWGYGGKTQEYRYIAKNSV